MDVKPQTGRVPTSIGASGRSGPASPAPRAGESGTGSDGLFGFAWFLVKLILAVLVIRTFLIAPFSIPSESMLPRLWHGDYLIATKWSYGYSDRSLPFGVDLFSGRVLASTPVRGDVVIFKHPVDQQDYVKRVIGLPGDTVAMVDGQVIINGEAVTKEPMARFAIPVSPYSPCVFGSVRSVDAGQSSICLYDRFREDMPGGKVNEVLDFGVAPGDAFAPATVPEGHMFVMGDNRDYSRDSRFPARAGDGVGMVPLDNLVGRARFIFWSTDGTASWSNPLSWFTATRWHRIGESF